MNLLPAFLDLTDVSVLLVGGGKVALRRALALSRVGARLKVVAPQIEPDLAALVQEQLLRTFEAGDLVGARLVVAATGDPVVNDEVTRLARAAGLWVNNASHAEAGNWQSGAQLQRGGVTIGINTGSGLPMLAQALHERIEASLPAELPLTDWTARREGALKMDGPAREEALGHLKADIRAWVGL